MTELLVWLTVFFHQMTGVNFEIIERRDTFDQMIAAQVELS